MYSTVVDTHRRVVRLDQNLEASIKKLNETAAELTARVNQSDQQTRKLTSMVQENQVKLDTISRELKALKTTVYRQWGLSTAPGGETPAYGTGQTESPGVTIEPPEGAAVDDEEEDLLETTPAPRTQPPPETPKTDPQELYQSAQKKYANENYDQALSSFNQFLAEHPNHDLAANAQFWKAKCLMKQGRYQQAIDQFRTLRDQHPTHSKIPFAMHNQAVAHSNLGQNLEAQKLMQEVIDNYPISPAAKQAEIDLQKLRGN